MKEEEKIDRKEEEESRGTVITENIPGFTLEFNKIARKHRFKVANKTQSRVKDLISNAKTPLGGKNTDVVYRIPCKCKDYSYTGETYRMWDTREREHERKVRLTLQDIEAGNIQRANDRMNANDGGLAKHAASCTSGIDWENARVIGKESRGLQRKYLEGIESLREKNRGITPLNSYNKLDQWESTLYKFFNL